MDSFYPVNRPSMEIRIAQIVSRLNIGGPAIYTVMLANHFSRQNFRSLLVTGRELEKEGDMSYLLKDSRIANQVIPQMQREINPVKDMACLLQMVKIFKRFKPHIVHTHTAKAGFIGRAAAVLLGIRNIVHTYHGHTFAHYFGPVKNRILLNIERAMAHHTTKLIAVTRQQVCDLVNKFRVVPAAKIIEMPHGLDLTGFIHNASRRRYIRSRISAGNNDIVVGIVGRLYAIKAHDFFLETAANVLEKRKDIHFVIVGDGDERAKLESIVKNKNIGSNVHFLGWEKDMPSVYAGMDIITLTSLNEGSPFSLIEGMASGLPSVSTSVGGVPDLFIDARKEGDIRIAKNGILVDKRDSQVFASALIMLADNVQLRKDMGNAARKFVLEQFTRERFLKDMENLYLSLLPWAR